MVRSTPTEPLARAGRALWRLLTSVDFAVLQIIVLSVMALIGMTLRQLPGFAFRSAGDYTAAMEDIHIRYDPTIGSGVVDVFERLSLFSIFTSPWFSLALVVLVISIVVCTLDRTP
ncbi:MAG: cytochrome c biogenesis protein ResB, partial [Candidatus Limnocylindrales bacterium]